MVHYGGDSGLFETYRKGTLHFLPEHAAVISNTSYPKYQGTANSQISTND